MRPGTILLAESEALAVDAQDDRVVEDMIEHRHGEHTRSNRTLIATAAAD